MICAPLLDTEGLNICWRGYRHTSKAGIQCGDIISKIDGTPTESMQSYYTYLQTKKQGENLTITVLRKNSDGEYAEKDYKVTVGER